MTRRDSAMLLADLETLCRLGAVGDQRDGRLIGRFLGSDGDDREAAFRALVDRHGPMVLRTCRSILHDPHAAQDVAQGVFLGLARRARSVRDRDSIGPWLHRVALRAACRARRESARRVEIERRIARMAPVCSPPPEYDDAAEALHEEIDRLPAMYRAVVLACDLEGLSHARAAARFGVPPRTLETRLYRGRARLRAALVRRGIEPAIVGSLFGASTAEAATGAWASLDAATMLRALGPMAKLVPTSGGLGGFVSAAALLLTAVVFVASASALSSPRPGLQEPSTSVVEKKVEPSDADQTVGPAPDLETTHRVLREAAVAAFELSAENFSYAGRSLEAVAAAQVRLGDREGLLAAFDDAEKALAAQRPKAGGRDYLMYWRGQASSLGIGETLAGFKDRGRTRIEESIESVDVPMDHNGEKVRLLCEALTRLHRLGALAAAAGFSLRLKAMILDGAPVMPAEGEESRSRRVRNLGQAVARFGFDDEDFGDVDGLIQRWRLSPGRRSILLADMARRAAEMGPEGARRFVSRLEAGISELPDPDRGCAQFLLAVALGVAGEVEAAKRLAWELAEYWNQRISLSVETGYAKVIVQVAKGQAAAGDREAAIDMLRSIAAPRRGRSPFLVAAHEAAEVADQQIALGDIDGAARTIGFIPPDDRPAISLIGIAQGYALSRDATKAKEWRDRARNALKPIPTDVRQALLDDARGTVAALDEAVAWYAFCGYPDTAIEYARELPGGHVIDGAMARIVRVTAERGDAPDALRIAKGYDGAFRRSQALRGLAEGIVWRFEVEERIKAVTPAGPR